MQIDFFKEFNHILNENSFINNFRNFYIFIFIKIFNKLELCFIFSNFFSKKIITIIF